MAQTEQHTPGPWEACEPGDYGDFDGHSRVICSACEMPLRIAVVHWHDSPDWREENDANARLIAAAPELLAQLEFAVKLLSGFPTLSGTAQIGAMRDVIARAKGQVTLTEYAAIAHATGASS